MANAHEINKFEYVDIPNEDLDAFSAVIKKEMMEHGDDGNRPRNVFHHIFNNSIVTVENQRRFANKLYLLGYPQVLWKNLGEAKVHQVIDIASNAINDNAKRLSKIAQSEGWQYNGWECEAFDPYTGEVTAITGGMIELPH